GSAGPRPEMADAPEPPQAEQPPSPPSPPSPPLVPVGPWEPSHLVSGRGLPAWDTPDPSKPATATLPPWIEVQVLDQSGAWAHVLCANGWQGWVDFRQLIKRTG